MAGEARRDKGGKPTRATNRERSRVIEVCVVTKLWVCPSKKKCRKEVKRESPKEGENGSKEKRRGG